MSIDVCKGGRVPRYPIKAADREALARIGLYFNRLPARTPDGRTACNDQRRALLNQFLATAETNITPSLWPQHQDPPRPVPCNALDLPGMPSTGRGLRLQPPVLGCPVLTVLP